jgi:hypothetical protein
LFLTKEKKVSTSTYVMMICGLRFFYTHTLHRKVAIERIPYPRRERKLPLILSRDEVKALLEAPSDLRDRAMLAILYGSGHLMIDATYPALAVFTGSVQSPRRPLSPVDRVSTKSPAAIGRRQSFSGFPTAFNTVRCKKPFNTQRLVPASFNEILSEVLRPGHPLATRHPSAGALPIESVSLSASLECRFAEAITPLLRVTVFSRAMSGT